MSPKAKGKSSTGWKPPRDRHEIVVAAIASLTVVLITVALVWFLRPNRESGSTVTDTVATTTPAGQTTTLPAGATTTAPVTTVPVTTAPVTTTPAATTSTP